MENLRGLGLAGLSERMRSIEEQLWLAVTLKDQLNESEIALLKLKEQVASLNVSVITFKHTVVNYKYVHDKFASVYKQDFFKIKTL